MIFKLLLGFHFLIFSSPGPPKWSKDVPKNEKCVKKRSPGKGLEKGPCLEGAKPLKVTIVTHFQLLFRMARAFQKGAKMGAKMIPKIDEILPKSTLGPPLGSSWALFLVLFFQHCF